MSFSATLTQNGSSVTGSVNNGVLTLAGTLRDTQGFTAVITRWTTNVQGSNGMSGSIAYTLTYSGLPGNAGIVATLNGVTRP
jgi:hypothetical protein